MQIIFLSLGLFSGFFFVVVLLFEKYFSVSSFCLTGSTDPIEGSNSSLSSWQKLCFFFFFFTVFPSCIVQIVFNLLRSLFGNLFFLYPRASKLYCSSLAIYLPTTGNCIGVGFPWISCLHLFYHFLCVLIHAIAVQQPLEYFSRDILYAGVDSMCPSEEMNSGHFLHSNLDHPLIIFKYQGFIIYMITLNIFHCQITF